MEVGVEGGVEEDGAEVLGVEGEGNVLFGAGWGVSEAEGWKGRGRGGPGGGEAGVVGAEED